MIKKKGNLFTSTAPAIGHGVNTKGVMGAGIAKEFKQRFPANYNHYRTFCLKGQLLPGGYMIYFEHGYEVVNLATQRDPGANANYGWLFDSCYRAAVWLNDSDVHTLAIPLIGCGIGGLEWNNVEKCLLLIEQLVPGFEFEVWSL